ncbi:hypothetical protein [Actinomyces glycerinitolerans]|uniref:Lipoprotein n=1 Tax=Actinomyces glycerinitolerans TaxID=1892869 RepID=A0A1M4RWU3_9ACTO|nr:hypothetical protein [Actinomyces glycerinitolerans]SHE24432.1 Hypothetical protein ACGLYG10_0633 [Actinomyces glycerinitolerans]
MRRFHTGSLGLRSAAAGAAALLLACAPLAACSSGSDDNPLNIPTYDPEAAASAEASESAAAAEASASAAASAEAAGVVTAESLSTDRYEVTSIPEDLDEQQTEVLKAFINYDQVTWNIWFTGTGVENAEPLTTSEAYQSLKKYYEPIAGETVNGGLRIAIISVAVTTPDLASTQAEVRVCSDQADLTSYDASGTENTDPETLQGRYERIVTLVYEDATWRTADEQTLSTNECWA